MGKLSFLVGFGAGYVFGAKAGERRYDQIKLQAAKAWEHPAVQEQVTKASEQIRERGPEVAAAAGQAAAKGAGQAVKNAASAGLHAATGKKQGPVVQGSIADGAADPQERLVIDEDTPAAPPMDDGDPTVDLASSDRPATPPASPGSTGSTDSSEPEPVDADTDSGETKLN